MKVIGVAILGLLLGGCASETPVVSPQQLDAQYAAARAGALAFDPPVLAGEPVLDLSRDPRRAAVFLGFDGPVTTFYDIRTDDEQYDSGWSGSGRHGGFGGDDYQRDAVSEKVGVNYR